MLLQFQRACSRSPRFFCRVFSLRRDGPAFCNSFTLLTRPCRRGAFAKSLGWGSIACIVFGYGKSFAEAERADAARTLCEKDWKQSEPLVSAKETTAADTAAAASTSTADALGKRVEEARTSFLSFCRTLWQYFKLEWGWFSLCLATSVLSAAVSLYLPSATAALSRWMALRWVGSSAVVSSGPLYRFLACISSQVCLLFLNTVITSKFCDRVVRRIRYDLYSGLLNQPLSFYDAAASTGTLVHRLSSDAADLRHALKQLMSLGLRHAILLAGNVASLFVISPKLTLLLMSVLPLSFFAGNAYGAFLRASSRDYRARESEATGRVNEVLGNMRLVLAFTGEQAEAHRYEQALERVSQAGDRLAFHVGVFQSLIMLSIQSVTLTVLWMGASSLAAETLARNDMPLGTSPLTHYLVMSQQAQASLAALSGLYAQVVKAYSSGTRLFEWMVDAAADLARRELHWDPFVHMEGRVSFEHVTFSYPTRPSQPVLASLCLTVDKGETVALCGCSGSGKSTIVALLERFYEPDSGLILIDQMPISLIDKRLLRRHIGYIPQEPVLFHDTILDNIRYGAPEATPEQVVQAAKQAHADEFIQALPDGYATRVGERGVALSGGQKQRIAIARAILKDPTILILDEATSALDGHSEHLVQSALENVMRGRTVIVIAHRLSSLKSADRILMIERGRVVEEGTHESLIKLGGNYAALYRLAQRADQAIVDA